jgi:exodeoxyribonuclease VII small subunit
VAGLPWRGRSWECGEEQTVNDLDRIPFEQAFQELEAAIQRLEEGDLTMEEALALYERGMRLARRCSEALDAAESQLQKLELRHDGQ